jgi:DNA-binding transcriptional MerR regulator
MERAATLPHIRKYGDEYKKESQRQLKEWKKVDEEQDPEVKERMKRALIDRMKLFLEKSDAVLDAMRRCYES